MIHPKDLNRARVHAMWVEDGRIELTYSGLIVVRSQDQVREAHEELRRVADECWNREVDYYLLKAPADPVTEGAEIYAYGFHDGAAGLPEMIFGECTSWSIQAFTTILELTRQLERESGVRPHL